MSVKKKELYAFDFEVVKRGYCVTPGAIYCAFKYTEKYTEKQHNLRRFTHMERIILSSLLLYNRSESINS